LPYIDLVNEVFERAVAGQPFAGESYQTTWTEQELATNPEHVNGLAYAKLRDAVFPLSLPLDLDAEESRIYLRHLGVERHTLMETFYAGGDPLDDPEIAAEYLGLTAREWQLIEGDDGSTPWALWGLEETDWLDELSRPRELMRRAGISFTELQELLSLGFVDPLGRVGLSFGAVGGIFELGVWAEDDPSAQCRLDNALIDFAQDPDAAARLCRILRLARRLDWAVRDLDGVLRVLGGGIAHSRIPLLTVSHLKRLNERLRLPVPALAALFGRLSRHRASADEPSQYERIFLPRSGVHPQLDDQREVFEPENLDAGADLRQRLPYLAAVLGIAADQLLILADWLEVKGGPSALTVDLDSLSMLYRLTLLTKVLGMSARELVTLIELHGIGPANPEKPDALQPFEPKEIFDLQDGQERLRVSGFAVHELDHLLRHGHHRPAEPREQLQQRAVILSDLHAGLRKIAEENSLPRGRGQGPDPAISDARGELLRTKLALVLEPGMVDAAMRWARGEIRLASPAAEGLPAALPHGLLGQSAADLLEADRRFSPAASLEGPEKLAAQQANYDYLLRHLIPWLRGTLSKSFLKQQLAQALSLDAALAERLLEEWVPAAETDTSRMAIEVFLDEGFVGDGGPLVAESYPEQRLIAERHRPQFATLLRLQKVAAVIVKLSIDARQAAYLFAESRGHDGWLDPRELPLDLPDEAAVPQALYRGWQRLVDLCRIRDRIGPAEPSLFDLLELSQDEANNAGTWILDPAETSFHEVLAERMDWSREDVFALCFRFGYLQKRFRDFGEERAYLRLERCFRLAERIGVAVTQPPSGPQPNILEWLGSDDLAPVARSIKLAARARYADEESWGKVARPLQDQIRERKRGALVDWLTTTWGWSAEDLYAHFLIDPEMSACMLTSRIKQAIGSVQLFIQRIFLGIEEVAFSDRDDAAQQWEWMKNYRVWEANRKIFLFPENWIEPKLRDDKSPFFKELENELRQSELTEESIEKAYLNYLNKLDAVSSLDIMAQCYDEDDRRNEDEKGRLHVFGRTKNTPHTYWYRYREDSIWSPWEKITADIEGEHLLPIVYNGRLTLYWPVFTQEMEEVNHVSGDSNRAHWAIRLAWAEYRKGVWCPNQQSLETLVPWDTYWNRTTAPVFDFKESVNLFARTHLDSSVLFDFQARSENPEGLTISVCSALTWGGLLTGSTSGGTRATTTTVQVALRWSTVGSR
jgi:hypothetical protein